MSKHQKNQREEEEEEDALDFLEETANTHLDLTESKGEKQPSPSLSPVPPTSPTKVEYRTLECEGNTAMDGHLPSAPQAVMTLDEKTQQFIIQVVDDNNPSFFLIIRIPQVGE